MTRKTGGGSRNLGPNILSIPVLFHIGAAPGGEVDVLGAGEDDEPILDPPDGEVGGLPVRLVRAHHSALCGGFSIEFSISTSFGLFIIKT